MDQVLSATSGGPLSSALAISEPPATYTTRLWQKLHKFCPTRTERESAITAAARVCVQRCTRRLLQAAPDRRIARSTSDADEASLTPFAVPTHNTTTTFAACGLHYGGRDVGQQPPSLSSATSKLTARRRRVTERAVSSQNGFSLRPLMSKARL